MENLASGQSDQILENKSEEIVQKEPELSLEEFLENPETIIDSLKVENSNLRK